MPIDPKAYKGKRIAPLPYDENNKPIPALFVPVVDPLTSEIAGYLPLKAIDNGDGTATLKVDTELALNGNITVGDVKVGSSDGQTSGDKWLRVLSDGTLLVRLDDLAGLATEAKQDAVLARLDVALSSRASETTLVQADLKLSDIKTVLDALNANDYATQTTLAGVKGDTAAIRLRQPEDLELLENGQLFISTLARNSTAAPENICLFVAGAAGMRTFRLDVSINATNPLFELYLNPTVSANGTILPAINLNRGSATIPTGVFHDAPTVTALGRLLQGFMIGTERSRPIELPIRLQAGDRVLLRRVLTGGGNELRISARWGE